jgi:hypothetical protein
MIFRIVPPRRNSSERLEVKSFEQRRLARYTHAMTAESEKELEYYRAIEDLFATLRGVPHVISPKDFQLLRDWWREEVPLAAVRAGVTEVFARHAERREVEPVVSLSYCRHAVKKHARRAAEMRVGEASDGTPPTPDTGPSLTELATALRAAADRSRPQRALVADAIDRFASVVEAAADLPTAEIEEHLFALESALLANCLDALDESERTEIEERASHEAEATSATDEARDRTFLALRDRLLREMLDLPRLELAG